MAVVVLYSAGSCLPALADLIKSFVVVYFHIATTGTSLQNLPATRFGEIHVIHLVIQLHPGRTFLERAINVAEDQLEVGLSLIVRPEQHLLPPRWVIVTSVQLVSGGRV